MTERIHLLLDRAEKERFRRAAARRGLSLSEWLRQAGHEKLRAADQPTELDSRESLEAFFESCDQRESGREPDWETHRQLIERSRSSGASPT